MKHVHEPDADAITLPGLMAALSDPLRVEIVRCLALRGEASCGAFDLGIAKATRSHHLRVLREAGLTHTRAEGTRRIVSLRRDELDARFPGLLDAVLAAAEREAAPAAPSEARIRSSRARGAGPARARPPRSRPARPRRR